MSRSKYLAIFIIALVTSVSFVSFTSFSQEKKARNEGRDCCPPGQSYVGSEACKECHQDLYNAFKRDAHWNKGCEGCHGPGGKHVEAEAKGEGLGGIYSFKGKGISETSEACLQCHNKQKQLFQFRRGVHKLSAVGCNDCHQIHGTRVAENLLKAKDPDLCFFCHADTKSKFYLPYNHRVLQGAVKCSDCHTPHGTRTYGNLRKINKFTKEDTCFKCHPEKRGPWVFEHGAQKYEGCSACHSPHGSPNRFLLTQSQIRLVCMQCHGQVHYPKFQCNNCHTQVHGSNFSSRYMQ